MTSTELTVVKQGAPLVAIDVNNVNYDVAEKWLATQGGQRAFAGEQLAFNGQDGVYKVGFGKNAQEVEEMKLVVNVPYTANAWQEWAGDAPNYPYIALPFAGQALPRREVLGHTDKSLWKDDKFKKGEKVDPCKEIVVIPARTESGRLFHFMGASITTRIALVNLVKDAVVDGKRNPGKLPLVLFTREKIKSDDGNYWVIKSEIVKWVAAQPIDNPGASMVVSSDETPADVVEAQSEKTVARPRTAKPSADVKKSRMTEVIDENADEPEEELKPAPKKRSLV